MKKISFFLVLVISILFFACHKIDVQQPKQNVDATTAVAPSLSPLSPDAVSCTTPTVTPLIGDNGQQVGTVTISNNGAFYQITYETLPGYTLKRTDLFVGRCDNLPFDRRGNPDFSLFQYQTKHKKETSFTYTTPVSDIGLGNCGCIVAYADVKPDKGGPISAYGKGFPVSGANGNAQSISSCPCVDPPQD